MMRAMAMATMLVVVGCGADTVTEQASRRPTVDQVAARITVENPDLSPDEVECTAQVYVESAIPDAVLAAAVAGDDALLIEQASAEAPVTEADVAAGLADCLDLGPEIRLQSPDTTIASTSAAPDG